MKKFEEVHQELHDTIAAGAKVPDNREYLQGFAQGAVHALNWVLSDDSE